MLRGQHPPVSPWDSSVLILSLSLLPSSLFFTWIYNILSCLEKGSYSVAQDSLKLKAIFLLQPPECWDL